MYYYCILQAMYGPSLINYCLLSIVYCEKSQNKKFAKIWTRENFQIYSSEIQYNMRYSMQC